MPLIKPLARYFSIPSRDVGGLQLRSVALNCNPCSLSCIHWPWAVIHSPSLTFARVPTTVTSSRRPVTFTRRTANPVSSLWKVTRSINPEIPSCGIGVFTRQQARYPGGVPSSRSREFGPRFLTKSAFLYQSRFAPVQIHASAARIVLPRLERFGRFPGSPTPWKGSPCLAHPWSGWLLSTHGLPREFAQTHRPQRPIVARPGARSYRGRTFRVSEGKITVPCRRRVSLNPPAFFCKAPFHLQLLDRRVWRRSFCCPEKSFSILRRAHDLEPPQRFPRRSVC